jgi:nucleoside-diphosphate-sugar epimerase
MALAEIVQGLAREERDLDPGIELVENPRGNETLVEDFAVDTAAARDRLGWAPERSVEGSIRRLLGS